MPCFSIVLETLEQSRPCFDLVIDIGKMTPIVPSAQYHKLPSILCFTMVLDTWEQFPHSSLPCFDPVLDIGEHFFSLYFISSHYINFSEVQYSQQHKFFVTSYLLLHPLLFVSVDPFLLSSDIILFSFLIFLAHAAIFLHGLLTTSLF